MTAKFQPLANPGEVLIGAYVGSGQYIFTAPANRQSAGFAPMSPFRFSFDVSKATSIGGSDYLRLETSPDDGTTWVALLANHNDAAGANFLDGKSGTSAKFGNVIWLHPGEQVRLLASAGLTLNKVGFGY